MDLLKGAGYDLADEIQFIDEYRILGYCLNWKSLVLWDLTVGSSVSKIEFDLFPNDCYYPTTFRPSAHREPTGSGPQRSYELFDTQPFQVNPEAGIVVLKIKTPRANNPYLLVIPTGVFVASEDGGFLGEEIPFPGPPGGHGPKVNIKWKRWGHFVMPIGEMDHFFSFHNHILFIQKGKIDGENTNVLLSIYDFSLYTRRERDIGGGSSKGRAAGFKTSRWAFDKKAFLLDTSVFSYDRFQLLPTENGILVIKVRIPVAAKCN